MAEAYERVWASLGASRDEVEGVLGLLEAEFGIEAGFFRPDDALAWLLEPVHDGGFWSGATNSVRAGDRQLELGEYLAQRCRRRGGTVPRDIVTLGEFGRACAGLPTT